MTVEHILVGAVLAAGILPLWIAKRRRISAVLGTVAVAAVFVFTLSLLFRSNDAGTGEAANSGRPIEVRSDGYVSSRTCRACHARQYATWHESYHRTMTQVADPDTVVGRFDGSELKLPMPEGTVRFRPHRNGNNFVADLQLPSSDIDGSPVKMSAPLVLTTGSHHMQLYWLPSRDGRSLSLFPFTYLIEASRWVPRQSVFLKPATDPVHFETGLWNVECIHCHATHGQPRIAENGAADTRVAEFGIACEACHGSAEQHVDLNRNPLHRYYHHLNDDGASDSIVNPRRLSPQLQSDVCGQCHSVWAPNADGYGSQFNDHGFAYRPGERLDDTRRVYRWNDDAPELNPDFMPDYFWSDGMIRVSGREYNGLIESPCFTHGDEQRGIMSCLSCHTLHQRSDDSRSLAEWANDQLTLGMDTNHACLQCHEEFETESRLVAHSHHPSDSSGSLCYNCHMPYTTYGLVKAIRSHEVSSPTVQESLQTGRPNACNQCHLDRTLEWTGQHLAKRYAVSEPVLTEDQQTIAASVLWTLSGDAGQRALMAWSMGWDDAKTASGTAWIAPYLVQLLDDPYDAVRYIAERSLRRISGFEHLEFDFIGTRRVRADGQDRALEIWRRQTGHKSHPAVLLDSNGRINLDVFSRLLGQRNDRPVRLKE